jgi:hypothetical protein
MLEEFTMQTLPPKQGHASLKLQGCKANKSSSVPTIAHAEKEMPRADLSGTTGHRFSGFPVWVKQKWRLRLLV